MAGASLRNAIKRRTHKERHQPNDRKRFGLLEKHKDYTLRAKDYNKKQQRIRSLQRKAEFRNPDEYYLHMNREATKDGIAESSKHPDGVISSDVLKLMKTQDLAYLNLQRSINFHKVERLRSTLHLINASPKNVRTLYVDDAADKDAMPKINSSSLGRYSRGVATTVEKSESTSASRKAANPRRSYRELEGRQKRIDAIDTARHRLELERKLSGKGFKRKVSAGSGHPGYKWRRERRR